jgi:hypothetical protein
VPSVGSVGDSYDNALAETINGLCKAEVIHRRGPWRTLEAVEYATLGWVDWYNNRRLLSSIGNMPPSEAEAAYWSAQETPEKISAGLKRNSLRQTRGGSLPPRNRPLSPLRQHCPVPGALVKSVECSRRRSLRAAAGLRTGSSRASAPARIVCDRGVRRARARVRSG